MGCLLDIFRMIVLMALLVVVMLVRLSRAYAGSKFSAHLLMTSAGIDV